MQLTNPHADSGSHVLSENIWFIWLKTSRSGENVGCHDCDEWNVKKSQKSGRTRNMCEKGTKPIKKGKLTQNYCSSLG